jgi:hypothetical protein
MAEKGWKSKGDKVFRRSPRQTGKTCGQPFNAPRKAKETTAKTAKIADPKDHDPKERNDRQVRILTEREIDIIVSMQDSEVVADKEVQEDREVQQDREQDNPVSTVVRQEKDIEVHSDTTGSTPEIFKSPERQLQVRHVAKAKSPSPVLPFVYEGPNFIAETEQQDIPDSSDSDDDVPVATLLRQDKAHILSSQQIQDCLEGPKGEKAIGVTVAKTFDSVEYRGTVDRFRTARSRTYYHVTYTDGDEEELTQRELRDGYILGLSKEIVAQSEKHIGSKVREKTISPNTGADRCTVSRAVQGEDREVTG